MMLDLIETCRNNKDVPQFFFFFVQSSCLLYCHLKEICPSLFLDFSTKHFRVPSIAGSIHMGFSPSPLETKSSRNRLLPAVSRSPSPTTIYDAPVASPINTRLYPPSSVIQRMSGGISEAAARHDNDKKKHQHGGNDISMNRSTSPSALAAASPKLQAIKRPPVVAGSSAVLQASESNAVLPPSQQQQVKFHARSVLPPLAMRPIAPHNSVIPPPATQIMASSILPNRASTPGATSAVGSEMEDERAIKPYLLPEREKYPMAPTVDDEIWEPKKALRSLVAFDLSIDQKVAFEDFLRQGRSKAAPSLIINYFKHYMCANSSLVKALQALPLAAVETAVRDIPRTTMMSPTHFIRMFLNPLLGKHAFLEQDALALFDFFDTDSDGEVDFRDLCNGCVLLRSKDGPIVPVVHKCMLLVAPKARREARLAMMTRLELLHLTEVLVGVLRDFTEHARAQTAQLAAAIQQEVPPVPARGIEMQQLRAQEHDVAALTALEQSVRKDVRRMLETFSLDRRGNFPYVTVRDFMLQSVPIQQAISIMRVPRDDDLYNSFLSEYFRQAETDDTSSTSREFRPLLRNKSVLLCGLQGTAPAAGATAGGAKNTALAARRQTFAKTNNTLPVEEVSCVDEERVAVEHDDPEYYTIRGLLYRRGRSHVPEPSSREQQDNAASASPSFEGTQQFRLTNSHTPQALTKLTGSFGSQALGGTQQVATSPSHQGTDSVTGIAAYVTKAEYYIEDVYGKRHHRF
ncbi:Hypothetical protein, putative [Bodo saltans]|uniref:EF-hand domain-containing protein n=1 Tax=Bodo saltans TaxID=75058 RepID=A0A0S4J0L2_BODSA|nr:Hypothetical protein, putative [Bodo saltans]|eukprot:CUG45350.1 Hypothetical protein, putative [Bodo saltans]